MLHFFFLFNKYSMPDLRLRFGTYEYFFSVGNAILILLYIIVIAISSVSINFYSWQPLPCVFESRTGELSDMYTLYSYTFLNPEIVNKTMRESIYPFIRFKLFPNRINFINSHGTPANQLLDNLKIKNYIYINGRPLAIGGP